MKMYTHKYICSLVENQKEKNPLMTVWLEIEQCRSYKYILGELVYIDLSLGALWLFGEYFFRILRLYIQQIKF